MRRRTLLAVPASLVAATAFAADEKPRPVLSVAIAVGKRGGTSRSIEFRDAAASHFTVVLRNEGDKPLRLWREWCSWGWYNITFQATTADGKKHDVKRPPRDWTKNYPDFEELDPGDCVVREVYYGSADWENFPRNPGSEVHKFKLQAFYEISPDAESGKAGVWTGKVESPVIEVAMWGLK